MSQKSNSTVTIDLSKLKQNIEAFGKYLEEETGIMAVVKADAYGHGAVRVAETVESLVDAFAVNDIHEGVELREAGIEAPILVFEVPEKSIASQYRLHNLTATISSEEHFEWLPHGTSYHLNFDTGMGRMGFRPEKAERIAGLVKENKELFCTGIYTHFATSDNPASEYVDEQYKQFIGIRNYFPESLTTHISNTGTTAFYDFEKFDMVRLGIGMYGYPPGKTGIEGIAPALHWKTRLVQTKRITAHSPVSYGAQWKAPAGGYLGVIPVGYDDGIKRNLTGKLSVRINNKNYEVVGTITMNYCMVYLGDDQYEPGTEVELLYPENDAGDWASKIGTIPYEILTSINPKIPREYL